MPDARMPAQIYRKLELVSAFTESVVEDAALCWLESLGWRVLRGPDIAPETPAAEREAYDQVVLTGRLRAAIDHLNPSLSSEAREQAFRAVMRPDSPSLVVAYHRFHRMLVDGVEVEDRRADGSIAGHRVRLVDFEHPEQNDWLAVNQFTVVEGGHNRRLDVVLFINGLPLAVIELKNAADEKATVWHAFRQLQTYKREIPSLFHFNEALVISDGLEARIGSLTADRERFMPWKTIEGEELA